VAEAKIHVSVSLLDLEIVQDLMAFCWHDRSCAAIDAGGEWHKGNPECTCGYDEVMARLFEAKT
jgi:hypothetical protein